PAVPSWIPAARPPSPPAAIAPNPPLPRHRPLPAALVRIAPPFADALERDLDDQIDALFAAAPVLPGNGQVVVRSDGGLWFTVGHAVLSTIFGVPAGAWRPAGPVSGVVPRVGADEPDVDARLRFRG
ncbi:MAG: hypothetical protein Q8S73_13520, partial [Deltaproteobacteria bacterium]|nr:hypothetical protein [Deltaproteobacteria bacterium]